MEHGQHGESGETVPGLVPVAIVDEEELVLIQHLTTSVQKRLVKTIFLMICKLTSAGLSITPLHIIKLLTNSHVQA
jgi:hypothetical protein